MMAEVMAQLTAQAGTLKQIEGAVELAVLRDQNIVPPVARRPAAYVIPLADSAGDNVLTQPQVRQRHTERFGVLLFAGDLGDARGEAAAKALEAFALDVRQALVGWKPTAAYGPVLYVDGRLAGFRSGVVIWLQRFRTDIHYSSTQ